MLWKIENSPTEKTSHISDYVTVKAKEHES